MIGNKAHIFFFISLTLYLSTSAELECVGASTLEILIDPLVSNRCTPSILHVIHTSMTPSSFLATGKVALRRREASKEQQHFLMFSNRCELLESRGKLAWKVISAKDGILVRVRWYGKDSSKKRSVIGNALMDWNISEDWTCPCRCL